MKYPVERNPFGFTLSSSSSKGSPEDKELENPSAYLSSLNPYKKTPLIRNGSVVLIKSAILSRIPGLVHAFFTRHGGVSPPPFDSLNVVQSVGDSRENVEKNISRIAGFLGVRKIFWCNQTHGASVVCLKSGYDFRPVEADAIVTDLQDIGLMIKTADCQAVLIGDPTRKVIAAVHCGWRGSVANILGRVVKIMQEAYHCEPSDLVASIGPSLGPCCAEFVNYKSELPEYFWSFRVAPNYFDFWAISRKQLMDAGLVPEHIEITGWCTKCHPELFFSYRRRKRSGRMASVIGLKE
ncbi:peptidoglycan editing factor PgeF [Thermodesulforhabdus norvegica]|uniref:Purine nucleoside phosphorylase n=1 Tax=Thermodesulforhabdus norvegica TaxID=39841 RepID=A0A1I4QQZ2_9BACT|nr:peptidoglycan editing factor PgeF [Thermodesulforhabdus norvegica]SFM42508.1 conserved hypothetical protein [Thermodesulforhabdus norvegica]